MSLDVYLYVNRCENCNRCDEVYHANITHNLNRMAQSAGLYDCLWKPEENGIETAEDLIPLLVSGLEKLKANPEHFKKFEDSSGWGTYQQFVQFVENYLDACDYWTNAQVEVCR